MSKVKDEDALGKKALEHFNAAFCQMSKVDDVSIICIDDEVTNKSPVHVHDSSIGIENWCVKYLFTYAYNKLMMLENKAIKDTEILNALSRCVVIFCPDCATAWNIRKKFFDQMRINDEFPSKLMDDLSLCRIALRNLPKSTEAFAHRRWILKSLINAKFHKIFRHQTMKCSQCGKTILLQQVSDSWCFLTEADIELLKNELIFCSTVAQWHPCNYSCWCHRVWLINSFIIPPLLYSHNSDSSSNIHTKVVQDLLQLLINESRDVMKWIESHVSDHSCMSYLQFILANLLLINCVQRRKHCVCSPTSALAPCCVCAIVDSPHIMTEAMQQCDELLVLHGGKHEALWCHRRALVIMLSRYLVNDEHIGDNLLELNKHKLLQNEKVFCTKFSLERTNDDVVRYVNNYLKYITSSLS